MNADKVDYTLTGIPNKQLFWDNDAILESEYPIHPWIVFYKWGNA